IFDYIKGSVNKEVFTSSKNRIISTLNGEDDAREPKMYADNLLELADNAKIAVEHGVKMEELDMDFDIIVGKAKSGIKTEAKFGAIEKAVSAIKGTKIGRFVNPATLTTAVGIAYSAMSATGKIAKMFGMSKIAAWTTFGVTAGISGALAAANESERLANERRELTRKLAKGGIISENSEENEKMSKYVYEMKSSNDLSASLRQAVFIKDKDGKDVLKDIKEEDLPKVLEILSEIETRNSLANEREIDLISYSNPGNVEKEKLDLIKLVAAAKYGVKSKLENELKGKLPGGQDFDAYFDSQVQTMKDSLLGGEKGITSTDKAFKWAKIKGSAAVGAKTVAYGIAFGALTQELFALGSWAMGGHKVGVIQGIIEQMKDGEVPHESVETPLETFRGWITGHPLHMDMNDAIGMNVDGHDFKAPQGTNIFKNPDGTFNILNGDRVVSENVPFDYNSDGTLSDATMARLGEDGIMAGSTCSMIESTKEVVTSANDWVHNHLEKTTHIMREWMGNDTPMYPDPDHPGHLLGADLNELRTEWVGNGIDEHGDYVMTVQHMTNDGSFQNGVSVAAQEEMKKGNLEVLFSVTKNSQVNVLKGIIGPDGLIHIPHDSLEGKMLFDNVGGHAKYEGAFLEIAKHNGDMTDGREIMQILSTHIGENNPHDITEVIPITGPFSTTDINLPIAKDGPWFIPVPKHKPLEPIIYEETPVVIPSYETPTSYGDKAKKYFSDLNLYRNDDKQIEQLVSRMSADEKLSKQFDFVLSRLEVLQNYDKATPEVKASIEKESFIYNQRYSKNNPIHISEYVSNEIKRLHSQIENIYIENCEVGDKPFEKSFYENSPLLKGLENCGEVVIVLPDPIGDAVLTLPLINSLTEYFKLNKNSKEIKVISKNKALYSSLEEQFPNVRIFSPAESKSHFELQSKKVFVFNANRSFEDYELFKLSEEQAHDLSNVMSVDWSSWQKQESPTNKRLMKKYDTLPGRVARGLEIMLGQKLFKDINQTSKYIETSSKFKTESEEIRKKYKIAKDADIFVISAGSSTTPKEYAPEKWREVMDGIYAKYPKAHILFLDDPDPTKKARYGAMVDLYKSQTGHKISRSDDRLDKMNTIMSMAKTVITPDTGLGHFAGALGTPTVMIYLSNPVLWSTPGAKRVSHKKALNTYKDGTNIYNKAWDGGSISNSYSGKSTDGYYVEDNGEMVGASSISPKEVLSKIG
ncbi:MAG: hypothetical protein NTV03_03580, partial [Candidatus Nomurabacteria bacterium]|nr:hypothetical protein [Candidatus Nomurabacteria bacterium]